VPTFVPFLTIYRSLNIGHILLLILFIFDIYVNIHRIIINRIFIITCIIPLIGIISLFINGMTHNYDNIGVSIGYLLKWTYNAFIVLYIPRLVYAIGIRALLISILIGCLLTSIWGWYVWFLSPTEYYGFPMLHIIENTNYTINRNYLSFYSSIGFCITFMLAIQKDRGPLEKLIYLIITFFMGYTVFSGFSKGGWISALLPIAYYLFIYSILKPREIIYKILLLPFIITVYYVIINYVDKLFETLQLRMSNSGSTIIQRFNYLADAFQLLYNNTLIGVGPKLYKYSASKAGLNVTSDPHNSWLWVGAEFGLLVFLIMFGLTVYVLRKTFKFGRTNPHLTVSHILMVSLLFHSFLSGLPFSTPIYWIILAIVVSVDDYYKKMGHIINT
jgi:hypothetical protein